MILHRLLEHEPMLHALRAMVLDDVFAAARVAPKDCPLAPWEVATALVRQCPSSNLLGLGLLVTLRPGLGEIGRRLDWGRHGAWHDRATFTTDLVSSAWHVLHQLGGRTLAFPFPTILRRTRQRLIREQQASRHVAAHELASCFGGAKGTDVLERIDRRPVPVLDQLARALVGPETAALSRDEARLLFRHRVLGYSLEELAVENATGSGALRVKRRRAEAKLGAR